MNRLDLTLQPKTDPTAIYRYRDGIYAVDLLITGIVHLDFFTWLAEHPSDFRAICNHFEITERPADVMLTLFASLELVEQRSGAFHVTPLASEHLVKGSPWFLGPYY